MTLNRVSLDEVNVYKTIIDIATMDIMNVDKNDSRRNDSRQNGVLPSKPFYLELISFKDNDKEVGSNETNRAEKNVNSPTREY